MGMGGLSGLINGLIAAAIGAFTLNGFQNFPGPVAFLQDFPVLENARMKFQDFPGPVRTLLDVNLFFEEPRMLTKFV